MAIPVVIDSMETEARRSEGVVVRDPLAMRLADGDPRAPRELVERHYPELYRYAFAMLRDRPAAEDMVHDAFERALEALGRYPEERLRDMALRPWLYRITLNVVRNRLKRVREAPIEEAPAASASDEPDDSREAFLDVLAALGRLPERQRTAVVLRYLQDVPYAEISAATGWPEGTAKTLVRRGLARLRDLMIVEDKDGGRR